MHSLIFAATSCAWCLTGRQIRKKRDRYQKDIICHLTSVLTETFSVFYRRKCGIYQDKLMWFSLTKALRTP